MVYFSLWGKKWYNAFKLYFFFHILAYCVLLNKFCPKQHHLMCVRLQLQQIFCPSFRSPWRSKWKSYYYWTKTSRSLYGIDHKIDFVFNLETKYFYNTGNITRGSCCRPTRLHFRLGMNLKILNLILPKQTLPKPRVNVPKLNSDTEGQKI